MNVNNRATFAFRPPETSVADTSMPITVPHLSAPDAADHFRAMLDAAPIGVVFINPDKVVAYCNREAARIWGAPVNVSNITGAGPYRLLDPLGRPVDPATTGLIRVLAGETMVFHAERIIETTFESRIWVEVMITALRDKAGANIGVMAVYTDITARKTAEMQVSRLLARSEARASREAMQRRVEHAIRGSTSPDAIQLVAAQELGRILNADRCFFLHGDTRNGATNVALEWHRPNLENLNTAYRRTETETGFVQIAAAASAIVVRDAADYAPITEVSLFLEHFEICSAIIVPIASQHGLNGLLAVAMSSTPRAWTPDDVSLTESVANQTRSAMEAAAVRLREHKIAGWLQDALLPRTPTATPGLSLRDHYSAALDEASVGGDFVDVFTLDADTTVMVVGDVSGKGLAAAAHVATVRNMVRYAMYRGTPLMAAMCELNDILTGRELLKGFVTLIVALFDRRDQTISYVSCGHETVLIRHANGMLEELESTGAVLGVMCDEIFEERTFQVSRGDSLLLYTDGVTEAGPSHEDLLGVDGLKKIVASARCAKTSSDVVSRVVDGITNHTGGVLLDDLCILVATVV